MSDEKQYRYYRVTGPLVDELDREYEPIGNLRNAIFDQVLAKSGAVGATLHRPFLDRHYGLIDQLAFPSGYDFGVPVEIRHQGEIDGRPVVVVSAIGKTKEAKALNAKHNTWVSEVNALLKDAPAYLGFVLKRLNLFVTGTVERRVVTPYGGLQPGVNGVLLLAIPVHGDEEGEELTIPEGFERITYGVFYDAMHPNQLD